MSVDAAANEPHDLPYPQSPTGVTRELTLASASYKRHAFLAMLGLGLFVSVYLGLTFYLGRLVFRLVGGAILYGTNVGVAILTALPAAFFCAFLVRGLFVIRRGTESGLVEITAGEEPRLFAFLRRLAKETGAPMPHRVFLSANVNAAVTYDLSFFNLVFPTKKNLVLGLGLVNVLTLDELKAVIGHELGHFAQRTMAVGRWVYISQQITGHIVGSRGVFDRILSFISAIDLRVAWIGWIMRVFVWAIRAVLDTVFRLVMLAGRALSREMEFQADRVAVSVSGSDSLIHALHRLNAADEAWEEALSFASQEASRGRRVVDLCEIQTAALEHLRRILDEPAFGRTPARPEKSPAEHRVFRAELAQPPRMWSTHPPNSDREDHAKAIYLESSLDERPAWTLFADPARVRSVVTQDLLHRALPKEATPPRAVPIAESLAHLEERFSAASLDPTYRGVYLGRAVAAYHAKFEEMFGEERSTSKERIVERLEALYPITMREEIALYREQRREEALLKGLEDGVLTAPGGIIRHRGKTIPRQQIASVIETAAAERKASEARILAHDRACRAVHLDAARFLGDDWHRYHESLVALLHYATHAGRRLSDSAGYLGHVVNIVLADGRVSESERDRVLEAASDLQHEMQQAWRERGELHLPPAVRVRFEDSGGFATMKQQLGLSDPTPANLGDWMAKIDGWAFGAVGDLMALADAALDTLLELEKTVARHVREGADAGAAPEPAKIPSLYSTCVIGAERERQKKLDWWDRFQTADGFVPGAARFGVASALLVPALVVGGSVGSSTVHVHNGLETGVIVTIDDTTYPVRPHATEEFSNIDGSRIHVSTTTMDGRPIEAFDEELGATFANYAYNVASAAPLVEWTAVYGPGTPAPEHVLGAPRWMLAAHDFVFVEPASSVETSNGGSAYRQVLSALDEVSPFIQVDQVADPEDARDLVAAHLRWDPSDSANLLLWVQMASLDPSLVALVVERAAAIPDDVTLQRTVQDLSQGDERTARCAQYTARSEEAPRDANRLYLSIRCIADAEARGAAFVAGHEAHPGNGWLAYAAASEYGRQRRWELLLEALELARADRALSPIGNSIAVDLARARNAAIAAGVPGVPSVDLAAEGGSDGPLAFFRAIEVETSDDPPIVRAYRAITHGELDDAVAIVDANPIQPDARDSLVALAAASDGASTALVDRAASLVGRPLDMPAMFALVGLAMREQWDVSQAVAQLAPMLPLAPALAELEPALNGLAEDPSRLQAIADRCDLFTRGQVLALGVVALGADAPPEWRAQAHALLFPAERPAFR